METGDGIEEIHVVSFGFLYLLAGFLADRIVLDCTDTSLSRTECHPTIWNILRDN
jgi:hypothetical protein